jgi:mitochondrial import inner membrane translocase subunit TIM22
MDPSSSPSSSFSSAPGGPASVFEILMNKQSLSSQMYSSEVALHKPVPIKDDRPNSFETITRASLPYPLPYGLNAAPKPLPPDFSWISSSCGGKAVIGVIGGGAMGLLMGVFLGAMSDATPPVTVIAGKDVPQAPFREQMRVVLRATGEKSLYWCKNFAFITGVFGGSECLVEKYRGKHDVWNSVASGCITGAALQAKSGPQAAAVGCGGFAAFSFVIDSVMGH